jgi:hypothetical protein
MIIAKVLALSTREVKGTVPFLRKLLKRTERLADFSLQSVILNRLNMG